LITKLGVPELVDRLDAAVERELAKSEADPA
jgi:hypothetical protein